jgi:nicotinate-nucleotide adenylyltransferase
VADPTGARAGTRVGIFGGSFDPIHEAHLAVARAARDHARLDRVLVMVARIPPHKRTTFAPAEDRLAMARLAIAGERGLEVSDLELRREGPSYTIDTVEEVRRLIPGAEIALVIGSDSVMDLPKWREGARLVRETTVLVAPRPGSARARLAKLVPALGAEAVAGIEHGWLAIPEMPISSTDLRARFARGDDVAGLVPDAVARYAREHRLYRAAP